MRDEHEMVKDPPRPYVGVGVDMFDGNKVEAEGGHFGVR